MTNEIYTFLLPDIGEGVVEGEIIDWLKHVGEPVKKDEPVVVVMTDKATVELSAPYPGTIAKQYYCIGETAFKDKPLYDIHLMPGTTQYPLKEMARSDIEMPIKPVLNVSKVCEGKASRSDHFKNQSKTLAIPKVRHLAAELNIDLENVIGTGRDGSVTLADLRQCEGKQAAAVKYRPLEGDEELPLVGVRGLMARKMDQIHIPQFSYFEKVDVTRLIQLRKKIKEQAAEEGINLSFMPFFIRALSLVLKKHPQMNCSINMQAGILIVHKLHNIGVAMATPQGLIVPVLREIQSKGFEDVVKTYEALKVKSQAGKLNANDMKDATITISNFGMLGEGMWATPMISGSEVAILALGSIHKAPIIKNNEIVIRDLLPLSWSFDHRVIDGELAAKISHDYCTLLRDPAALL